MILRKFPLNFSVFFHIAINKNISGIGKKRESLEGATNRLLNPEPSNESDPLYLDKGKYYRIINGIHPVPENNLVAVKECDQCKLAENIISIWLKNEEDSVKCITTLLYADLLYLENDQAKKELLEYVRTEHFRSSIAFKYVIDYLQSEGDENDKIKKTLIEELKNSRDDISEDPFDLLKFVVSFCRTTPQKFKGSQPVVNNIIGLLKKNIYPKLHIVEIIKRSQDLLNEKKKNSEIKEYFDGLYFSPFDNNTEEQITNEQVLDTLDFVATFFLDADTERIQERSIIIKKATAVLNLAYILHSVVAFCRSKECTAMEKKTVFQPVQSVQSARSVHPVHPNLKVLELYKTMAREVEPTYLRDYVKRVRMLQASKDIDYIVFLLLVLKSYNSDDPIYEGNALNGVQKILKSLDIHEFVAKAFLNETAQALFWNGIFILQEKNIMRDSLRMVGDKSTVESELRAAVNSWIDSNTPPQGDLVRFYY